MKDKIKSITVITLVVIGILLIGIVGASYAYFSAWIGESATTTVTARTNTVDNLMFIAGNDITLIANQSNFKSGSENISGSTSPQVKLTAGNGGSATYKYRVYLLISENNYVYTTNNNTPELTLTVQRGSTTVVNNMDITTRTGIIDIPTTSGGTALKQSITASAGSTTTETWTATVTFVNLNSNQTANAGKNFRAILYIDESPTLPSTYQEVAYLGSNGTQYIDTGVVATNNMVVEADVYMSSSYTYESSFLGASGIEFFFNNTYGKPCFWTTGTGGGSICNDTSILDQPIHYVAKNISSGRYLTVDGKPYSSSTGVYSDGTYNLHAFAYNSGSQATYGLRGRIYYLKIYINDELVRYFIPCYRKSDTVYGMYDTVNKVFYTNAGSGSFTAGSNVT